MRKKNNEEILKTNKQKSVLALLGSFLGTMLPFIIMIILFFIAFTPFLYQEIMKTLDRGDFFIYSAGLLTTAIISFINNRKSLKVFHKYLCFGSVVLIIVISICYAGCSLRDKMNILDNIGSLWFVRIFSIIMLIFSGWALKNALDYEYIDLPDVQKEEEERTKKLAEGL
jgi:hypothetical protein